MAQTLTVQKWRRLSCFRHSTSTAYISLTSEDSLREKQELTSITFALRSTVSFEACSGHSKNVIILYDRWKKNTAIFGHSWLQIPRINVQEAWSAAKRPGRVDIPYFSALLHTL